MRRSGATSQWVARCPSTSHSLSPPQVHEEEWSYIPVGGPLPVNDQSVTAFGAAASLIHPATGFSVSRSFREAPQVADEIQAVLKEDLPVAAAAKRVWERLWDDDKRAQVGVG